VTPDELTIREVAAGSGVVAGTLRMWEARYGFPEPHRLPSGHRRYTRGDVELVRGVVRARKEGLSLPAAIARVRSGGEETVSSVFRALCERFPALHPHALPKRVLVHLSHAIEDECALRAPLPLLFASFQHERFYRAAQPRWRELARTAERVLVFADFPDTRQPDDGPAEVRLGTSDPLMREWVIVCDASRYTACLVGWERPRERGRERLFETIWTVDPAVVREAARVCARLAGRVDPGLVEGLDRRLAATPPAGGEALGAAVELTTRMILYATAADS